MRLQPVVLESPRVRLEPVEESHLDELGTVAQEPDIWRYMSFADLRDAGERRRWMDQVRAERERGTGIAFAIVDKESRRLAGSTTFFDYSEAHRHGEIGRTWLGREYRRTRINTEAKRLLLGHAFEALETNRVQIRTDGRNERSQRAIERLGATREGVLRAHMVMRDGYVRDTVVYSVIAPEWPAVRARLDGLLARGGSATPASVSPSRG